MRAGLLIFLPLLLSYAVGLYVSVPGATASGHGWSMYPGQGWPMEPPAQECVALYPHLLPTPNPCRQWVWLPSHSILGALTSGDLLNALNIMATRVWPLGVTTQPNPTPNSTVGIVIAAARAGFCTSILRGLGGITEIFNTCMNVLNQIYGTPDNPAPPESVWGRSLSTVVNVIGGLIFAVGPLMLLILSTGVGGTLTAATFGFEFKVNARGTAFAQVALFATTVWLMTTDFMPVLLWLSVLPAPFGSAMVVLLPIVSGISIWDMLQISVA